MEWNKYYESRVNSKTYDEYFSTKYKSLIDLIVSYVKNDSSIIIVEEGCGIGSVTKQLLRYLPDNHYILLDKDNKMLALAKENLKGFKDSNIQFFKKDILTPLSIISSCEKIVITHGVLEHFSDKNISKIINNYCKSNIIQFHYVPIDGYSNPSFGDERLLSSDHWKKITKFQKHIIVNKQDLYFQITN